MFDIITLVIFHLIHQQSFARIFQSIFKIKNNIFHYFFHVFF